MRGRMSHRFTIRDLAGEFDITPRTLRFYEEKGLLTPEREGQNRIYDSADRTRLRLILRGRKLGFTLQESADLIGMYDPASDNLKQLEALAAKIRERRDQLEQQRHELERMIGDVAEWQERTEREINQLRHTSDQHHNQEAPS